MDQNFFAEGIDEETTAEKETVKFPDQKAPEKKKPIFAYWTVKGKQYPLKLTTSVICEVEKKFKTNLLNVISSGGGLPPLSTMLTMVQAGMKAWTHGVTYSDVQRLFDSYCEDGGTQLTLLTDVLMPMYQVSGFFSQTQAESMNEKIQEAKDMM